MVEMVQGLSLSTLATSGKSGVYGSIASWRKHYKLMKKTPITSATDRHYIWPQYMQSLFLIGNPNILRHRNLRVDAGWLFKGGGQGLDASSERSESANEDILIFFFQLDLATRVQYALNLEQYETAQQLRNKLTEVEAEVMRQQEAKRGSSSKSKVQDKAISIIRLRADLQHAIENENYALAADLRDEISKLESESLAASVNALAYENVQYSFRLGQKVRHKIFGYCAVICGMDPICCESSSWMEIAQVEKLSRGSNQPFYQVLVDVHADPNLLVAYVPEENLLAPDQPDMVIVLFSYFKCVCVCRIALNNMITPSYAMLLDRVSAALNHIQDRFDHPYISFLFYGVDGAGDFIPIKQLREKYNRPRHEVPYNSEDEKPGGDA